MSRRVQNSGRAREGASTRAAGRRAPPRSIDLASQIRSQTEGSTHLSHLDGDVRPLVARRAAAGGGLGVVAAGAGAEAQDALHVLGRQVALEVWV